MLVFLRPYLLAAAIAAVLGGFILYQHSRLKAARADLAVAQTEVAAARAEVASLRADAAKVTAAAEALERARASARRQAAASRAAVSAPILTPTTEADRVALEARINAETAAIFEGFADAPR